MDNFNFFGLTLGKLPNYMQYFGSNNVEGVAESYVETEMSWVKEMGVWFSDTHFCNLIKKKIFSRYLDFYAFVKFTYFKSCGIINIGITSSGCFISAYFFWILSTLKRKSGQILVWCKTNNSNISNMAQDWRLESSSWLFYDLFNDNIVRSDNL